jgi:hypothetical protein
MSGVCGGLKGRQKERQITKSYPPVRFVVGELFPSMLYDTGSNIANHVQYAILETLLLRHNSLSGDTSFECVVLSLHIVTPHRVLSPCV